MGHCLRKEERAVEVDGLESNKKRSRRTKSRKQKIMKVQKSKRNSQELFSSNVVDADSSYPLPSAQTSMASISPPAAAHIIPEADPTSLLHQPCESAGPSERAFQANLTASKRLRMNTSEVFSNAGDSALPSPIGSDQLNESFTSPIAERKRGKGSPMRRMFASPKLAPRVLFKSPLPKHLSSALRREKNNSTSSLYITDTINSPNTDEIIRCMSTALQYHIKQGMQQVEGNIDRIFSEKYHPLTRELLDLVSLPDVNTIYRFVNMIFQVLRLPPECAILCLAYIERILSSQRVVLHPENWRRIVFGSILIATKVWEDESVWNVDFLDVFPLLTLVELNNLENRFMELLQFNVLIIGSEYAKYYFELRALSTQESFPLAPLNKEQQMKLEERGQRTNEQMSRYAERDIFRTTPKRARSVDYFEAKSPPAVLA